MITNNIICGDVTQARDQQNLDAVKSCPLKFLMAFNLKKVEERIQVSKNRRGKKLNNKIMNNFSPRKPISKFEPT